MSLKTQERLSVTKQLSEFISDRSYANLEMGPSVWVDGKYYEVDEEDYQPVLVDPDGNMFAFEIQATVWPFGQD